MVVAKLRFKHHKLILTFLLPFILLIGVILGRQLSSDGISQFQIISFSFLLLTFVTVIIILSMNLRLRDEIHQMHKEYHERFDEISGKEDSSKKKSKKDKKGKKSKS